MTTAMAMSPAGKRRIRIRMYNVGFGDCFLIRLPTKDGERRMLVDCGYHTNGKGKFDDRGLIEQIKKDLDGEGLDVVVATHRHQDHISGFGQTEQWKEIGVEEVWLPFTAREGVEKEEPSLAFWNRLMDSAHGLVKPDGVLEDAAAKALPATKSSDEDKEALAWMLWNARTNAEGIANLRRGMKRADGGRAKRRYLPDGKKLPFQFESPVLPGATIHVLGPSRDPAYRRKKSVPAGWGVLAGVAPEGGETDSLPFGPEWRLQKAPARPPFQRKSIDMIREFNGDITDIAAATDAYLNGESLVLVIELGAAKLLLTGDAEVGAWMKILEDADSLALAASATFFKVGHHGSHNATPLVFLDEHLAEGTPAMMSTQKGKGQYRNGIPRPEILKTFDKHAMPYARSDVRAEGAAHGTFERDGQDRWVDCEIPC